MNSDVIQQIELEIAHNCAMLDDYDPQQIDLYRSEFYSLNEKTTDINLLYRPPIDLLSLSEQKLRNLRRLYFSKKNRVLSDSIRSELNLRPDPISYAILSEMRDME